MRKQMLQHFKGSQVDSSKVTVDGGGGGEGAQVWFW